MLMFSTHLPVLDKDFCYENIHLTALNSRKQSLSQLPAYLLLTIDQICFDLQTQRIRLDCDSSEAQESTI